MAFAVTGAARLLLFPPAGGVLTTRQASLDASDRSVAPPTGLSTLRFDPGRFPPKPAACYRASWQLPGPDLPRLAATTYVGSATQRHLPTLGTPRHGRAPSAPIRPPVTAAPTGQAGVRARSIRALGGRRRRECDRHRHGRLLRPGRAGVSDERGRLGTCGSAALARRVVLDQPCDRDHPAQRLGAALGWEVMLAISGRGSSRAEAGMIAGSLLCRS
jgi:hypothetical protein